jgi:hypothetical protein
LCFCEFGLFHINHLKLKIYSQLSSGRYLGELTIKNKNSEAIGYVATYIIPFLFQSLVDGMRLSQYYFCCI